MRMDTEKLQRALSVVNEMKAVKNKKMSYRFARVFFDRDVAYLEASDGEDAIRISLFDVAGDESFMIPIELCNAIAREVTGSEVSINEKKGKIFVKSGSSEWTLDTIDTEQFSVPFKWSEDGNDGEFDADQFTSALDRVSSAMAKEASRYMLNGVLFDNCDKESISLVATDGTRLSVCQVKGDPKQMVIQPGSIVHAKAVQRIGRVFRGEGPIKIWFEGPVAWFKSKSILFGCKMLEGRYPPWRDAIPGMDREGSEVPGAEVGTLLQAIRTAAVTAGVDSSGVKFKFEGDELKVSNSSSDVGATDVTAELTVPVSTPVCVMVDYRKCIDFLQTFTASTPLVLNVIGENESVLIDDEMGSRCVIMPMSRGRA